ncbi:hypothetical protein [Caballeronia sp. LZ016]|uniref:hypothetical protein n=1 Tax=Caballeronia sp. LZ016 TaxID=3038554 RepID=UPI002861CFA6|nr:hypothetical protein [Caballeronia sp. LZ016]MDR5740929.1 hypothetical protein [Caballeronia sp. LZ016]
MREALERVLRIAPHVRLANRHEARLASGVGAALRYARELVDALPAPRDATPAAWADDPYLRAMFATADDIARVIGQSHELRGWFDTHYAAEHAYAVLSSRFAERRVLAVASEGGVLRSDVPRVAVSFDDKRIRICDETDAALRREIVLRVIEQLALEGMSRVAAHEAQREALQEARALLAARMQMLGRRGAGMSGLGGASAAFGDASTDFARLQRDIADNESALAALGSRAEAVEQQLGAIVDVFAEPSALIRITQRGLRVNQMNLIVEEGSDEHAADLTLVLAHLPMQPPETRAVDIVRIARRDMPPAGTALDDAVHWVL